MLKFQMSFLGNLCIFGLFLLLRATEIPKKFNNRIVKLFRKMRLGRGVCLSLVTRSLKRSHLPSLSRSCSQFEMLQMLIHLMSDRLSTSVLVCWLIDNLCLVSNRLCCVIFEIMLGKVSSYLSLTFFPKIKVHLFTNKNDELTFWWFGPGYLSARVTFFYPEHLWRCQVCSFW